MSSDQNPQADEPKIVVDSDWKEQVAKEKEAEEKAAEAKAAETSAAEASAAEASAAQPQPGEPQDAGDASSKTAAGGQQQADAGAGAAAAAETAGQPQLPPASFEVLVSMLFSQAMAMLGQVPDPSTGKTEVNKPYAKHTIDTLEVLSEKTQGNLTEEESRVLGEALHALRMAFVSAPG